MKFIRVLLFSLFGLLIPLQSMSFADKKAEKLFFEMPKAYEDIEDYEATFIRQETVRGKLRKPEKIAFYFKRPFKVRMRWLSGSKTQSEIVYVKGENDNKILVKMKGLLGGLIKVLKVDVDGYLARRSSSRPVTQAGIGKMIDSLIDLTTRAKNQDEVELTYLGEEWVDDRKVDVVERLLPADKYEAPRTLIYIDKRLDVPIQTILYDGEGEVYEQYKYQDLLVNVGLEDSLFTFEMRYKDIQPSHKAVATVREVIEEALDEYEDLEDYTAKFIKQWRVKKKLQPEETYLIKFRKPFNVYMKAVEGPRKGMEILYRPEIDGEDKMFVRPWGLVGAVLQAVHRGAVPIDIHSNIAMKGNRHKINEFGLGYFLERYIADFEAGVASGEFTVEFRHLEDPVKNELIEVKLGLVDPKLASKYYAASSIVRFSEDLELPIEIQIYNEKDELVEHFRYEDLEIDEGLEDEDFDPNNPEYGFV